MTIETQPLNEQEQRAAVCICILAAYSDGAQVEVERAQIQRIINGFAEQHADLSSAYQDVLEGKLSVATLAKQLESGAAKALAYEMAVCVCNADGLVTDSEKQFLATLRRELQLDAISADAHQQTAQALIAQPLGGPTPPVIDANRDADLDRMILNAAILNGALEIIPHTLATMAIVPLQMRLVYNIGNRYGFSLDRGHITDFLATVGVGLTSQVVEGYTERLIGTFARRVAGGFLGGLIGQAAGSAFGFATTYAVGQVAKSYYASGRTLTTAQLKDVFTTMLQQGKSLRGGYAGEIAAKARQVNVTDLMPLIRSV